jgi:DNA repair protein RecO (recombination protein O)
MNDNDKLLTVLTSERGRITVMAKHSNSIKSRVLSGVQPFTYSEFELYLKDGLYWMRGVTTIEPFAGITSNIEKISMAAYFADVADEFSGEAESGEEILKLTLNSYYALSRDLHPIMQIKGAFELRAAAISGYRPNVDGCRKCKKPYAEIMYMDVMNGRMLCEECLHKASVAARREAEKSEDIREASVIHPMSPAVAAAVKYVLIAPPARFLSFQLKENDLDNFSSLAELYLLSHVGHAFETLDFYKALFG